MVSLKCLTFLLHSPIPSVSDSLRWVLHAFILSLSLQFFLFCLHSKIANTLQYVALSIGYLLDLSILTCSMKFLLSLNLFLFSVLINCIWNISLAQTEILSAIVNYLFQVSILHKILQKILFFLPSKVYAKSEHFSLWHLILSPSHIWFYRVFENAKQVFFLECLAPLYI